MPDDAPSDAGLMGSIRRLCTAALFAVETRLGLLATDVEREGLRLAKLLLWGAVCLFLAFVGATLLLVLLVIAAAEEHRLWLLALLSGLSLAAAAAIVLALRGWLQRQPRPFDATLTELARDRERLNS